MDCIFCQIAKEETNSASIRYNDDEIIAFDDIHPKAPIHIVIIPKRHIPTLNDIGENEIHLTGRLMKVAQEIAKEIGIAEDGYRVIMNCNHDGGQEVFHIHLHLLGGKQLSWPNV